MAAPQVGAFDGLLLVLIVSALAVDVLALAALGENLILLVNLAGAGYLHARFLRGSAALAALERWQMAYLPAHSAWAAVVAGCHRASRHAARRRARRRSNGRSMP